MHFLQLLLQFYWTDVLSARGMTPTAVWQNFTKFAHCTWHDTDCRLADKPNLGIYQLHQNFTKFTRGAIIHPSGSQP
jgi:hypothetical protein